MAEGVGDHPQGNGAGTTPDRKRDERGRLLPGHSYRFQFGNPGRQRGSRNKLSEQFLSDLHDDWVEHGRDAIRKVREETPAVYVRVVARVIPQHVSIDEANPLEDVPDELLAELVALVRERASRRRALEAKPVPSQPVPPLEWKPPEILPPVQDAPWWPEVAREIEERSRKASRTEPLAGE